MANDLGKDHIVLLVWQVMVVLDLRMQCGSEWVGKLLCVKS